LPIQTQRKIYSPFSKHAELINEIHMQLQP